MNRIQATTTLLLLMTTAMAEVTYTGYSGAPGSNGTCAGACHGGSAGTIQVVGFPTAYTAGQSYVISVVHRGGLSISNFNASVRVGSSSQTAGTISAGYMTATYSAGNEPNGVHLSSRDRDSCTFSWQAPAPLVGDVKLYLAGHQGLQGGANTEIVLTATQGSGVSEYFRRPVEWLALAVEPAVATDKVSIRLSTPAGSRPSLRVVDRSGRLVAKIGVPESDKPIVWRTRDREGRRLAAGTYLVVLQVGGERLVRKLVLK
jgi:hypothetical protein